MRKHGREIYHNFLIRHSWQTFRSVSSFLLITLHCLSVWKYILEPILSLCYCCKQRWSRGSTIIGSAIVLYSEMGLKLLENKRNALIKPGRSGQTWEVRSNLHPFGLLSGEFFCILPPCRNFRGTLTFSSSYHNHPGSRQVLCFFHPVTICVWPFFILTSPSYPA